MDIVTLGLRVNDDGTVKLKAFGDVSEQAAKKIASLEDRLNKLSNAQGRAGLAGEGHRLATGRVSRALEGLIVSTVGANSHLGVLSVTLSDFALGGGVVTAILAGVGAIAFAYEKLTDASQKAIDTAQKLREKYQDLARIRSLGVGGEILKDIQDLDKGTKALESRAGFLREMQAALRNTAVSPLVNWLVGRDSTAIAGNAAGRQSALNEYGVKLGEDNQRRVDEADRKAKEALDKATAFRLDREKQFGAEAAIQAEVANQRRDALTGARQLKLAPESLVPDIGLGRELTELEKRTGALLQPFEALRESVVSTAERMKRGRDNISLFKADWSHPIAGAQAGAEDALGGFLQNLTPAGLAFSAVSSGLSLMTQGLTQAAARILGFGESMTAMRLELKKQREEYDASIAAYQHDDLGAQLANNLAQADALRQAAKDTLFSLEYALHHGAQDYKDALAAIDAAAAKNAEILKRQQVYAQEDLEVRNLRATGRGDAADLLAFQEKQAREMQSALDSNKDATYINTLKIVEQNELLAFMNGLLSDAVRNSPTGFFANAYYSQYATPRGGDGLGGGVTGGGPDNSGGGLTPPGGRSGGSPQGRAGSVSVTIPVILDGRVLTTSFVKNIDQYAASTGGAGTSRADALNRMPA